MGTDINLKNNKSKNDYERILEELKITAQKSNKHKAVETIREFQELLDSKG